MYSFVTFVMIATSLWVTRLPAECEFPPLSVSSVNAPPWWYPQWSDEHYASAVVGSEGVSDAELALGGQNEGWAQLSGGSIITFAWTLPLKSEVALWLYTDLVNCPYSKVTTRHYIDLGSTPIYTSNIWVTMGEGWALYVEFEPYEPPDLPFHRYVVLSTTEPLRLDAIALLIPYNPIRRWMPIMMAQ